MKKSYVVLALILLCVGLFSGCISGDGEPETTTPAPTTAAPTTVAPTTPAPTTLPPTTLPPYTDVKEINASDENGSFEVTITEVGMFTHSKYNTAGPETTHFRVDVIIRNTLNAARSIYPNINCYIVDDENVRWPVYFVGCPTDLSGEYSGLETREGYLVFESINTESSVLTFTIEIPTANLPVKVEIPFTYP